MSGSSCAHPISSVVESRTFTVRFKGVDTTVLEQTLTCVDCHVICETTIT